MKHQMTRIATLAALLPVLATACTSRESTVTAPLGTDMLSSSVAAPVTFDCVDQGGVPYYAFYNARGRLVGNQPYNARVYRPYVGDTLSKRAVALLTSPLKYPGYSQYNVWNVTGGPATGTTNYFFLLFPKVLPGPGGVFPAELHVQFNKGQAGSNQSIEMCTVQ
ncbi:MAG: hypothetical protein U0132_01595 [Gemmatimonadaceae bacterium]